MLNRIFLQVIAAFAMFFSPQLLRAEELSPDSDISGYSVKEFAQALRLKIPLEKSSFASGTRKENIETALGTVYLRQPSGFESMLRVSPAAIIRQAWNAASQLLATEQFPEFEHLPIGWNIVVTNQQGLRVEGSKVSSEYCHTALMGPPADVLIDGYRLFHPCRVVETMPSPEARLLRSLTHEVGHGVEYQILGKGFSRRQRWHSEGFASWFESRAVDYLPNSRTGELRELLRRDAKREFRHSWKPYFFSGTPADYAMSYALVAYLAETKGVPVLLASYRRMSAERTSFAEAVAGETGMDFTTWMENTKAYLDAGDDLVPSS